MPANREAPKSNRISNCPCGFHFQHCTIEQRSDILALILNKKLDFKFWKADCHCIFYTLPMLQSCMLKMHCNGCYVCVLLQRIPLFYSGSYLQTLLVLRKLRPLTDSADDMLICNSSQKFGNSCLLLPRLSERHPRSSSNHWWQLEGYVDVDASDASVTAEVLYFVAKDQEDNCG